MRAHYGAGALPCRVADPDRKGKVESAIAHTQAALNTRLPMAEGVVLATARLHQAMLWTQDADFERLRALPLEKT